MLPCVCDFHRALTRRIAVQAALDAIVAGGFAPHMLTPDARVEADHAEALRLSRLYAVSAVAWSRRDADRRIGL